MTVVTVYKKLPVTHLNVFCIEGQNFIICCCIVYLKE